MTKMCIAAANFIIETVNEYNKGKSLTEQIFMSSKRLQKLLFFSDVLYMVENEGHSMFSDEFYAWPSGPVIPSVYKKFMQYQDGEMKPHTDYNHEEITTEMRDTIKRVLDATCSLDTKILVEKSHCQYGPWAKVFDPNNTEYNCIMKKSDIYEYYKIHGAPYGMVNHPN